MKDKKQDLMEQYMSILNDYLAGAGEAALLRAHDLGRKAIANGIGVLEMAEFYFQSFNEVIKQTSMSKEQVQIIRRLAELFMENLSIYEMIKGNYIETSTMLRQLNETLGNNERLIKNIFAAIPSGLLVYDRTTGKVISANRSLCEKFCLEPEDITGKLLGEVLNLIGLPQEVKELITKNSNISRLECRCNSPSVGEFLLEISLTGERLEKEEELLLMFEDITERKQIEQEMDRLERLKLVGEMAASISHEIRNPMTTVRGFLQILGGKKKYILDKDYFDLMIEELDRANSIITEYLSMASNKTVDRKKTSLNTVVKAIYPLISADALITNNNIELELGDIPELLLDQKEIRQLILNLTRNGLEAMQCSGNKLVIKTYAENGEVVLAIQDEGTGIDPDILKKLGTPFFTTKKKGTGLGLSVCYSIAARHNARIEIVSNKNGSTFLVKFANGPALSH